jgi:hypothetical protein
MLTRRRTAAHRSHFYDFVKRRALDPEAPVLPWAPGLLPRALSSPEAEAAALAFAAAAPTSAPVPRKRPANQFDGKHALGAAADGDDADADAKRARGEGVFEAAIGGNRIGDADPAADFARELAANTSGIVGTLNVMGALRDVLRLMVDFLGPARYPAVLAGLQALRRECINARTSVRRHPRVVLCCVGVGHLCSYTCPLSLFRSLLQATFAGALEDMFARSCGQEDGGIWRVPRSHLRNLPRAQSCDITSALR